MAAYIRPLSSLDVDRCAALESAAFPPSEAATYEKIDYRLSTCPEVCYGLFLQSPTETPPDLGTVSVLSTTEPLNKDDVLVAHIISTRSNSPVIIDQDMDYPRDWKSNPRVVSTAGHQPTGTTVSLHSLAVSPTNQRQGLGKLLMNKYIERMKEIEGVERVSLLTYDRLVPYYEKLGFKNHGKSAATYAGVSWNDLSYELLEGRD